MKKPHSKGKFVIISDGHLLQSYMKPYDPLPDLKTVLNKVSKLHPNFVLLAGDMFDKKKTETSDVRHPEGEEVMMKVREILEDLEVPVYSIRGNHEDERVLQGLQQTISNFYYVSDSWKRLGNTDVYFMDTRYEAEFYDERMLETDVKNILHSASRRWKKKSPKHSLLITHEWFADSGPIFPAHLLGELSAAFDWILNGHMHFFAKKHLGIRNLFCLPSLLPSRLPIGKYWTESYSWMADTDEFQCKTRESPFGFVELEIGEEPVFHRFDPSVKIVNLAIDVTKLDRQEVRRRLKHILDKVNGRKDRDRLVVLPLITGSCSFSPRMLEDIYRAYGELNIQKQRDATGKVSPFAPGVAFRRPIVTIEQLAEELLRESPLLMKMVRKEGMHLTSADVRNICKSLTQNPYVLQKSTGPVYQHLANILELITTELEKKKGIKEPPSDYSTFLTQRCKEAIR